MDHEGVHSSIHSQAIGLLYIIEQPRQSISCILILSFVMIIGGGLSPCLSIFYLMFMQLNLLLVDFGDGFGNKKFPTGEF